MIEFLEEVYEASERLVRGLKFNKADERSRTIMALYLSVIEQVSSQIILLNANRLAGVEIIYRSTLEAFIDLVNLTKDAGYLDNMKAAYSKEMVKLMADVVKDDNPFLSAPEDAEQNVAVLARHKQALEDFKARGVRPLNVVDRFTLAEFGLVYSSVYRALCRESHNNVGALTSRHFRHENGKFHVVIFKKPDDLDVVTIFDSITSTLCTAGLFTHDHFKSEGLIELQQKFDQLQIRRQSYT